MKSMLSLLPSLLLCFGTVCSHGDIWDVFSTNTLYGWAHPAPASVTDNSGMNIVENNTLCKAIHINTLFRSGALVPSKQRIGQFNDFLDRFAAANPNVEPSMRLSSNFSDDRAAMLTDKGVEELFALGVRFRRRFSHLIDADDSDSLVFATTSAHHSGDSARIFFGGLMNTDSTVKPFTRNTRDDSLLVYQTCDKYQTKLREGTLSKEFNDFNNRLAFQRLFLNPNRLNMAVSVEDVYLMNDLCPYGMIIKDSHLWCDHLNFAKRKALEYGQDLQQYYATYDRSDLNRGLICPFIRDVLTKLDSVIEGDKKGENYTVGVFQFGSAEVFLSTIGALGLYNGDGRLTATTFNSKWQFRSSQIAPFSANIAFVIYKCGPPSNDSKSEYLIKIYVNEEDVVIPACGAKQCRYEEFRNRFSDADLNCNVTKTCMADTDTDTDLGGSASFLTATLYLCLFPLVLAVFFA